MATKHDQLMKELLSCFSDQFLILASPELADQIDLGTVHLRPEEHYPGAPTGRERRPDLVSRARTLAGDDDEVVVHVEIELRYRGRRLPKLLVYHRGLSLRYALSVHTLVLYLHGGPPGSQHRVYEERSLGRIVGAVGYYSLGLSRVPASEYLARPEPLAWAFASLMRPARGRSRAQLGLRCVERIASAKDLGRREQDLLFRCVWMYGRFNDREAQEFDRLIAELEDEEVQEMKMSMAEWWKKEGWEQGHEQGLEQGVQQGLEQGVQQGVKQGVQQGEASMLRRLLRRRFNQLPKWVDRRLEQASPQDLEGWANRVFDEERLEDVFSSA